MMSANRSRALARRGSRRPRHRLSDAAVRMALRATWREARATMKDGRAWVRTLASRK